MTQGILAAAAVCLMSATLAGAEGAPIIPSFVPSFVPSFADETASAGITSVYAGDWQYMVGGGVATFDCNKDGFSDMLLAGGARPATFYRNTSRQGGTLSFVAEPSGLEMDAVTGAYPVDIDSDGVTDIILLRVGESVAMRGLGSCKFARANTEWGFDGGDAWTTAMAAIWEKGADWPTVALGTYVDRHEEAFPWGSCTDNHLLRGGAGKFEAKVPLKPSFCALSMLFTDWNRSGQPSLRVSNDREYYKGGQEQLWRLDPGQPPVLYTADDGWQPLRVWGMGIAARDLDLDGYPEYFVTSMADNKLQALVVPAPADGPMPPTYTDVAFARNAIAQRPYVGGEVKPSTAWHAQFEDVNNDGLADLFVAKGNVSEMPDFAMKDPNNLMLQQADGRFVEVGDKAGVASFRTSRGAALADFNMDGLMDLVVVNRGESAQLWRNTTAGAGHWIAVRLDQPGPNRQGVGSFIEVRFGDQVHSREVSAGGGHASGHSGWWHFGLGAADKADVRVIWPDGTADPWEPLTAGTPYTLQRGQAASVWLPPPP